MPEQLVTPFWNLARRKKQVAPCPPYSSLTRSSLLAAELFGDRFWRRLFSGLWQAWQFEEGF